MLRPAQPLDSWRMSRSSIGLQQSQPKHIILTCHRPMTLT